MTNGTINALNQLTAQTGGTSTSVTYRDNGNVAEDNGWEYSFDAENRLSGMRQRSGGTQRLEFRYDYVGRRIEKKVFATLAATTPTQHVKYVYDGWNLIAEVNGATPDTVLRTFTWGLDASETLGGAGGVGGLLRMEEGSTIYYPVYDPSHNVTGLMRVEAGVATLVASYQYGPFGEKLGADWAAPGFVDRNPFRFSTKYTDVETGLVYYGHRYYDPKLGRFLGRDPLGEAGGNNLYGFVKNNPVNAWDYLGMEPMRPVNQEDDFVLDETGRPTHVMKPFIVEVPKESNSDDGLGSAWWLAPGGRGGSNALPALAGDIGGSFGPGSVLAASTTATMAPGAPTQLPDGTVMLPRVTVKISRLTYLDYVHADSYALIGNLLNLVGVPALGDLALAYRAQIYGNRADRDDALAMAVIGGALTVAPARGGVLGRIGAGRAAENAAARVVTHGHRGLPKFLGGDAQQILSKLDPKIHSELHSILRQNLREAGIPLNVGGRGGSAADWARYMNANPGAQRTAFDAVLDASRAIDVKYGTSVTQDVWRNVMNGSFTPFP